MDKGAVESAIAGLEAYGRTVDNWVLICAVGVALFLAAEAIFSVAHWRNENKLRPLRAEQSRLHTKDLADLGVIVSVANDRTAQAELELAKLQAPRTLRPDQEAKLIELLLPTPKGPISVVAAFTDSTDAKPFSDSIREALRKSEFIISEPPKAFVGILSWDRPGAFLLVKDLQHPPPHAVSIQKAFAAVGIYLEGFPKPDDLDADAVVIAVSSHPFKVEPIPPELIDTTKKAQ